MSSNSKISVLKKEGNKYFIRNKNFYKNNKENYIISDLFKTTKINVKSILEIGCANGAMLDQYRKALNAKICHGIDLSPKAINDGKKRFKNIKFKVLSSLKINEKIDRNYDLIICGFFLYLLNREKIFYQFHSIYQKLNKNGYLLIYDYDPLFKHSNTFKHNKSIRVFKMTYDKFLEESGLFKLIYKFRTDYSPLKKNDLKKFKSNDCSFSLFQKIDFIESYPSDV
jgi:cyclopropane fatty-acyl-phospholipid synthase-like methyltransferase